MGRLKPYQVMLDPEIHERLREIAFVRRTTVSALIRSAVENFVRKHGPSFAEQLTRDKRALREYIRLSQPSGGKRLPIPRRPGEKRKGG